MKTLEEMKARTAEVGECWEWLGGKTDHGKRYPAIKIDGKVRNVRRLIYTLAKGEIKADRRIVPKCGNPYCLNPDHARAVSEKEKCRLAAERGSYQGEARKRKIAETMRNTRSKITLQDARDIRLSADHSEVLAEQYAISKSRINRIRRGVAWKDYTSPWSGLGA